MDRLETCFKFIHRFTKNAINAINNAKKCKKSQIGTACLGFDFHAETPSGFFTQFVRENKTILHFFN